MKLRYIAFLLIIFTVTACKETADNKEEKSKEVENTVEVVEETQPKVEKNIRPLESGEYFTLSIGETSAEKYKPHFNLNVEENRISGFSGCNNFSGSFTMEDGNISFDKMVSTKKMCAEGMEFESQFLKSLEETEKFNYKGYTIQFLNEDDEVLMKFKIKD
ncbi:META domain-containing protein [Mesonia phycicola]|uniref:META domain-containing protein n=1 Tax=Mesonia phycicola TaxID=579105 RepID=A0A1M6EQ96_9FLAO|nr:META domain-containing protein [Mesonia phycicola]SHI87681.1 META domain-containing protein [Mesonia phycicola]